MCRLTVIYHNEAASWWANSPDVPDFHVGGETLSQTRDLVREGLPSFLEVNQVDYLGVTEKGKALVSSLASKSSHT